MGDWPYAEGTFFLSGVGHLLGGYDAGYYGYLWAEVIGDDMFGRFARGGVPSPEVGAAYRREVLEPNRHARRRLARPIVSRPRAIHCRVPAPPRHVVTVGIGVARPGARG